jgi:hypothetical protein
MKAKHKTKELDAFVERVRAAFDKLDGREAEKLLKSLDRKITQTVGLKEWLAKTKAEPPTLEQALLVTAALRRQAL